MLAQFILCRDNKIESRGDANRRVHSGFARPQNGQRGQVIVPISTILGGCDSAVRRRFSGVFSRLVSRGQKVRITQADNENVVLDKTVMSGAAGDVSVDANASARHIPVLRREAIDALKIKPGGVYLDGTFGAGGYTRAILDAYPDTRVMAIDRDPDAIVNGMALVEAYQGRLTLVEGCFGDMEALAQAVKLGPFDGIVLDIGVSSMQLDEGDRGFSFRHDGPLDMRMAQEGRSAAEIVNEADETELADIFYYFGEERLSRLIAKAIVMDRKKQPFTTTRQLSEMIGRIVRTKPGDIHPATRTFQALRIAVNDELGELVRALHGAERILATDGRLSVVSFHSLEDRIVKVFFASRSGKGGGSRHAPVAVTAAPTFRFEGKWPVSAGEEETRINPRARSAKLRAGIRNDAPARHIEADLLSLATLPTPKKGRR